MKDDRELVFTIRENETGTSKQITICNETNTAEVRMFESSQGILISITDASTSPKRQEAAEFLALRSAARLVVCAYEEGYIKVAPLGVPSIGKAPLEELRRLVREDKPTDDEAQHDDE